MRISAIHHGPASGTAAGGGAGVVPVSCMVLGDLAIAAMIYAMACDQGMG